MTEEEFRSALASENKNAPQVSIGLDGEAAPGACNVIFTDAKSGCGSRAAFKGVGDCGHLRICHQCVRSYLKTGRPVEALERIEIPPPQNSACVLRPTRWQRFVRWLFPSYPTNRMARMEEKDPFQVRDVIRTSTVCHLDWKDRLRVLISGRCQVEGYIRCENTVGAVDSVADFNVLPPAWMDKEAGK